MIGIIGAMDIEIENITKKMTEISTEIVSGIRFTSGYIGTIRVVAAVCGIGKVFAAVCAQTMIIKYSPSMIINTGVAGTLTEKIGVLDTVIADFVVQHDMDTTFLGDEPGLISGINIIKFPCDKKMIDKAVEVSGYEPGNVIIGTVASGDCFVASPEKKERISELFGAVACEMEGGAIGHVCYINKVPFEVIRTISDSADGKAHISYEDFKVVAAKKSAKIVTEMIKQLS